jgi:Fur family peroxide stress response transcriptional regulator
LIIKTIIIIVEVISVKIERHSRQRNAIRNYILSVKTHPDAETIHMEVKKLCPDLSVGTTYRNLSFLEEKGEIKKIAIAGCVSHYDGQTSPHNHFFCKKCKKITDFYCDVQEIPENESFDGIVEGYEILFYGLCGDCR